MPNISKHLADQVAERIWAELTESEQHGVRFGLFPMHVEETAKGEGISGREICLALMRVAAAQGGMRA